MTSYFLELLNKQLVNPVRINTEPKSVKRDRNQETTVSVLRVTEQNLLRTNPA